jgi:hypothetical protein
MSHDLVPIGRPQPLMRAGLDVVPVLFADAGERAAERFIEFFYGQYPQ